MKRTKNSSTILVEPENPRSGWNEAFKKMAKAGDDKLLDATIFELESDRKEWKWKK